MKDRQQAQLSVLRYQAEFCRRLKQERVLVVTAETGSGKSTQLPQYAAEHFGSLVVCTQPRVVAALSLARRVAEEYDGKSVGESVGYQVGNANRVSGTDIMFMTDAALIRESQRDPALTRVRVLIIDEAHERSLNTDIVLGMSKLLLKQRPDDFYVVIASATIDPARFLQFFDRSRNAPLIVEGRVFSIKCINMPISSDSQVVSTVAELYPKHEGHTLVFLPGQAEIDRALRQFKSRLSNDCVVFPLYGSQTPEDQEKVMKFNEPSKRMVVFCTNVAETSLTIPNVRLVIDSGWAKEARYDVQRRITVIETVRISRSSADQRRGRAGRTADGHCVRLYDESELKRPSIEPEILRSSLDLVLLQLIRLNLDPNTFPFLDQPAKTTIRHSLDLLTKLQCVDAHRITKRGELFTELGFDPRLSAFILDVYMEYETLLELAAGIVAILSAPGTVFYMGGSNREAKQEAKAGVALRAHSHKSDLIHLYSVYNAWKNAGTTARQGKCSACTKQAKWCICRVKHSNENGLNNKILQNVDASIETIIKHMKEARWLRPANEMPKDTNEIIGVRLAQLFPEQCGYLLVPQLPAEGVRLIASDIRALIKDTSVFMQRLHGDSEHELYQHCVAMTITQLPSGKYIVDRLHPVPRTQAAVGSSIEAVKTMENIGPELFYSMRQKLLTYESELWAKWAVYQYDRPHCRFMAWATNTDSSQIVPVVQRIHSETLKQLSDAYASLECGPIKATFHSGLVCTHIDKMTHGLRLDLQNVPSQSAAELKVWLRKIIGVEWDEIKEHHFHVKKDDGDGRLLTLKFKNEDAFQRAKNKVPPYYLNEKGYGTDLRSDEERETWGRDVVVQTPANVTIEDVVQRYGTDMIIKCVQLNKPHGKAKVESSLKLNNLPPTSNEAFLRECLQTGRGPSPKHIHVATTTNGLSGWARITFSDENQRNEAAAIYDLRLCQSRFPITVMAQKGPVQKYVQTTMEKDDGATSAPAHPQPLRWNRFRITMLSREAAWRIFSSTNPSSETVAGATSMSNTTSASEWTIDSSATVTILRTDLYPDFQQMIDRICEKFGVQSQCKDKPHFSKRYTFTHGSPQKTSLAASMLAQNFAPINYKLNTDRKKQLLAELEEVGQIQAWAHELALAISKNRGNTNLEIRGPQIAQGQLMRRIADYSDDFDARFRVHELSATTAAFFSPQKAAAMKLNQLAARWSPKSCSVSFLKRTSTIVISGKPDVSLTDMIQCENEVMQLLTEITAPMQDEVNDDNDDDEQDASDAATPMSAMRQDRRCVFCQQTSSISTSAFRICGHGFCRCAAQALSSSAQFPLQCKDCRSNIHIRDIEDIFSTDDQLFMDLRKRSIQNYLQANARQDDCTFCPHDECDGLITMSRGYQTCLTCGRDVCSQCQVMDDELHMGRTCAQLVEERRRGDFFLQLFNLAKKFLQDHWPIDSLMQPIGRIDENPYLVKKYESWARFSNGAKMLGHPSPPDLAQGFFAYHGTSSQAIAPICQTGFDPKRRSGQVHGRGEYFGVTANISHGYAQKPGNQQGINQMIIAFLVRCPLVTTKEGFCYVVDNPTDWTYAFNLPVLIVTYGQQATGQPSPFACAIPVCTADHSVWNAPFRWYWHQYGSQYEPYNDSINMILEAYYEQWRFQGGSSTVVTPPLRRYLDDIPQAYQIDYGNKRQMNLKTSYTRAIDRRPTDKPPENQNWFYENEHGQWTRYESLIQNSIEKAYQLYRAGGGVSYHDIRFPGRPEVYQLNFSTGQQTNKTTNVSRNIKRA